MVKPIPDNVKEILSQLSASQQVVLRSYIATLRSEIVTYEEEKLNVDNADPQAHFHGDVKCTADHGHVDTEHTDDHHEHVHTEHCAHEHDHKDTHGTEDGHEHKHAEHSGDHGHSSKEKDHDHGHHEHKHTEKHDDNHQHAHHEHTEDCGHGHDHKEHHHDHTHTVAMEHDHHDDDAPAWKKAALSADPMAAPFGGTWNAESNISASDGTKKMEE